MAAHGSGPFAADGADGRAAGAGQPVPRADPEWWSRPDSPLASIADLKGKRVELASAGLRHARQRRGVAGGQRRGIGRSRAVSEVGPGGGPAASGRGRGRRGDRDGGGTGPRAAGGGGRGTDQAAADRRRQERAILAAGASGPGAGDAAGQHLSGPGDRRWTRWRPRRSWSPPPACRTARSRRLLQQVYGGIDFVAGRQHGGRADRQGDGARWADPAAAPGGRALPAARRWQPSSGRDGTMDDVVSARSRPAQRRRRWRRACSGASGCWRASSTSRACARRCASCAGAFPTTSCMPSPPRPAASRASCALVREPKAWPARWRARASSAQALARRASRRRGSCSIRRPRPAARSGSALARRA